MRWRKTSRPRVWVGNLLGVTVTDPAGFATIVPFPQDPSLFLDGTGHWSTPVTAVSVSAVGYWTPITNGDPASPEILFDAEGDCVVGFVPTPEAE